MKFTFRLDKRLDANSVTLEYSPGGSFKALVTRQWI
jgi:hypothetical protein